MTDDEQEFAMEVAIVLAYARMSTVVKTDLAAKSIERIPSTEKLRKIDNVIQSVIDLKTASEELAKEIACSSTSVVQ
jgi:hypothetical protein